MESDYIKKADENPFLTFLVVYGFYLIQVTNNVFNINNKTIISHTNNINKYRFIHILY